MTIRRRVTIDPQDLIALEYECPNDDCGLRYSIPLKNASKSQMRCPSCGTEWIKGTYQGQPDPVDHTIRNFARALAELRTIKAPIRLEIDTPPIPGNIGSTQD
jgi:hypothetical protein